MFNNIFNNAFHCLKPDVFASLYSKFAVGSVVLAGSGQVYTGTNVENASYPAGCCAERSAIYSAISNGEKVLEKLVIVAVITKFFIIVAFAGKLFWSI